MKYLYTVNIDARILNQFSFLGIMFLTLTELSLIPISDPILPVDLFPISLTLAVFFLHVDWKFYCTLQGLKVFDMKTYMPEMPHAKFWNIIYSAIFIFIFAHSGISVWKNFRLMDLQKKYSEFGIIETGRVISVKHGYRDTPLSSYL